MPVTRYGLMTYSAKHEYNVGDYIQSLAARQYLPKVDAYLDREKLSLYQGDKIKLILNGWFLHEPGNWPPSEKIEALPVSFHLDPSAKDKVLSGAGLEWFKNNGPIGCRDEYTLNAMQKAGVPAYLSECLTTTLRPERNIERTDDIYFVDVLFQVPGWNTVTRTPREFLKSVVKGNIINTGRRRKFMKQIFSDDIIARAIPVNHYRPLRDTEERRFEIAKELLAKYSMAKMVVTSRLHCALPCLAFGTPVLFIDGGFKKEYDRCRLDGVTEFFNTVFINTEGRITANFDLKGKITENTLFANPIKYLEKSKELSERCHQFINQTNQR